jgi:hypothetical protein
MSFENIIKNKKYHLDFNDYKSILTFCFNPKNQSFCNEYHDIIVNKLKENSNYIQFIDKKLIKGYNNKNEVDINKALYWGANPNKINEIVETQPPIAKKKSKVRYCETCKLVQASFNYPEFSPRYCKKCKLKGMSNTRRVSDICQECNVKRAIYNFRGLPPRYCSGCKTDSKMIDVVHKKCLECQEKIPSYNYSNLPPRYCADCKESGMIRVRK